MARIIPIDVIKGISGKYGGNSNDYFATNTSSNKIHLAKLANPYTGDPTEKQVAQRTKFAAMQASAAAWLNANKPSEANGTKGTAAYQYVEKLKRNLAMSNINQVLFKYMDAEYNINLPAAASSDTTAQDSEAQDDPAKESESESATKVTLTLAASPEEGGTVTGAGEYDKGSSVEITASSASGYSFTKWSDNSSEATRTITLDSDLELTATFTKTSTGFVG